MRSDLRAVLLRALTADGQRRQASALTSGDAVSEHLQHPAYIACAVATIPAKRSKRCEILQALQISRTWTSGDDCDSGRDTRQAPATNARLGLRTSKRYDSYMSSSHAELNPAPPAATALPCTMCVIDAKQAAALGKDIPEPLPGALMVNGMLICDIRHALNVGPAPSSLLIAPANTLSNGGLA